MTRHGIPLAALAAAAMLACALSARAEPQPAPRPSDFPRVDALRELGRKPAGGLFSQPAEEVDGWTLADPPAEPLPMGLHAAAGPFEGQLASYAAKRRGEVRLTEPMACLARQVGRFVLARKVRPGPATLTFLSSRCGVAEPIGMAVAAVDLRGDEPEALVQETLGKPLGEDITSLLERGPHTAGVWYGREGSRAMVLLATARPRARLDAFPRAGRDGWAVVTGELLRPVDRPSGLITQGRFGFRACEVDPRVALPRFSVRCPIDPGDPVETLEIAAFERGRIFGPVVATAQIWPGGAPASFTRAPLDAVLTGPGDRGEPLPRALLGLVNRLRKEAGVSPLALAAEQSETAAALAPHYFKASAARDEGAMETIVLGLRAGWQVAGLVRAGLFASARTDDAREPGRLLAAALARPSGREALLHPEAKAVAIGVVAEERGAAAIFATYALVDPARAASEAEAVVALLDAARGQRGLAKTEKLAPLERRVAELASAIEHGDVDPRAATKRILPKDDPPLGLGMRYSWIGSAERLDALAFPADLVDARSLRVAVAVAHRRPEGSPWARYFVVVAGHAPRGTTASTHPRAK